jgi:hypothetical protein
MEWSPDGIIAYVQLSCESEATAAFTAAARALMTAFGSIVGRVSAARFHCVDVCR